MIGIYFTLVLLTANKVNSCLVDEELHAALIGITFTTRIEDVGDMNYQAFIDLTFNITSDVPFDGILYHFSSDGFEQKRNRRSVSSSSPDFFDGFDFNDPCEGIHDIIWTVADNGTSMQCEIPCNGIIKNPCRTAGGICSELKQGFKSLRKETRNFTLPIKFGHRYQLDTILYRGWKIGARDKRQIDESVLFCKHELLANFNITYKQVAQFCDTRPSLDRELFISGPITNLLVTKKWTNLETNKGEATITWQDPHDIYENATITGYSILHSTDIHVEVSRNRSTIQRAHLHNFELGKISRIVIQPLADYKVCHKCSKYGRTFTKELNFLDINACSMENETLRYCVPIAKCVDLPSNQSPAALCTCPNGYHGNGVNQRYNLGTGCKKHDPCANETNVKSTCVEKAICMDDPTALEGFNCSCLNGFDGDAYINGTGCNQHTFQRDAMIIGVCIGSFALVFIAIFIGVCYYKKRKDSRLKLLAQYRVSSLFPFKFSNGRNVNTDSERGLFGAKWELQRSHIKLKGIIGRGNFGVVQLAILDTIEGENYVAVKMTTEGTPEDQKTSFIHEISILSVIEPHPNLLGLIGCCSSGDLPIYMVTQYLKYGDLLGFLWKAREKNFREVDTIYNINELSVYHIASQVACGMQQLKKMKIIHGDLAARNILVGEGLECKISDFGLANDVYVEGMLRDMTERMLPIRWVSPERMMGGKVPIDWRSDVWSFGVLLYETVTLGSVPYHELETSEIFSKLRKGYRMEKPEYCTQKLYDIMMHCWEWNPLKRLDFNSLEDALKKTQSLQTVEYVDLHSVVSRFDYDVTPIQPAIQGISCGLKSSTSDESGKLV